MRDYWVMVKDKAGPQTELVPEAFSWGALLIPLIWALYCRMWRVAAGVLALVFATPLLLQEADVNQAGLMVAGIVVNVVLGWLGNDLRRWELRQKGFRPVDIVRARRLGEAEELAIMRLAESESRVEAPAPTTRESELV